MSVAELHRLWYTIKWLRPIQLWGRLWIRLYRPRPDCKSAPKPRSSSQTWQFSWRPTAMLGPTEFSFLGVERALENSRNWNHQDWPKLWLYNLHYFDDLNAANADERLGWHCALIQRWIQENSPGQGNGWEPYPTSLRLVNWIKWMLRAGNLDDDAVHSLAVQARWLRRRLEYHLLGNHLWVNAKGLVFAGAFFEGAEANSWLAKGLDILRREIDEQILEDGGHFERSPMYHATLLEDVLDLIQLSSVYPDVFEERDTKAWRSTAMKMTRWLRAMTHPDGGIAFFNDAAFGIAPTYADLIRYVQVLDIPVDEKPMSDVEILQDSGYVRLQSGPAVLFVDVGEIGPDYLPGHAHADTLSFELSIDRKRVFVNGGTSTYETGHERMRQRGTPAHNTVVVDGQDSSEVWGSFRVARRARPFDVTTGQEDGVVFVEATHDGYQRLPGKVIHRRRISLKSNGIFVEDSLSGNFGKAVAMFHLHPEFQVSVHEQRALISNEKSTVALSATGSHDARIENDAWNPEFGKAVSNKALHLVFNGNVLRTTISWGQAR